MSWLRSLQRKPWGRKAEKYTMNYGARTINTHGGVHLLRLTSEVGGFMFHLPNLVYLFQLDLNKWLLKWPESKCLEGKQDLPSLYSESITHTQFQAEPAWPSTFVKYLLNSYYVNSTVLSNVCWAEEGKTQDSPCFQFVMSLGEVICLLGGWSYVLVSKIRNCEVYLSDKICYVRSWEWAE